MRVLFLSADLGGNVPPTRAIARELCDRGAAVEVAGIPVDAPAAPGTAAPTSVDASWAPKRDANGNPEPLGPTLGRIFLSRRLVEEAEAMIRNRRPDVVVVDCMALALIKGALRSGVPVVVLLHTFAEYWRRAFLRGPVAAIVGALGFSPRALWAAATARLLLTDPVLDPGHGHTEFTDYTWTGTTEIGAPPADPDGSSASDRPRVVVSFSTTALPGMRRAYRHTIEAMRDLPVDAIVTTGGFDLGRTSPPPPNVSIRGFVPHSEVLPGAALVIGHGGHSTTMKALAHGIPLLVLPLNPTADQRLIGEVVEKSQLGRALSSRSGPGEIRRAAADLLRDAAVQERARATGARLRSEPPGARVAAEEILRASEGAAI